MVIVQEVSCVRLLVPVLLLILSLILVPPLFSFMVLSYINIAL
jgi:hypothetical protein